MAENRIDELKDAICELVNLAEDADITREVFETIDNAGVEIIDCLDELKRWRTCVVNNDIKNPFANTSTLICHNCDHKDEYIVELEMELENARKMYREFKEWAERTISELTT